MYEHFSDFTQNTFDIFNTSPFVPDITQHPHIAENGFSCIVNNMMAKTYDHDRAYDGKHIDLISPFTLKPINALENLKFWQSARQVNYNLAYTKIPTAIPQAATEGAINLNIISGGDVKIIPGTNASTQEMSEFASAGLMFDSVVYKSRYPLKFYDIKNEVYPICNMLIDISNLSTKSCVNHLFKLNLRNNFFLTNASISLARENILSDMLDRNIFYLSRVYYEHSIMKCYPKLPIVNYMRADMLKIFVDAALNISTTISAGPVSEAKLIANKLNFENYEELCNISERFLNDINNLTLIESHLKSKQIITPFMYRKIHLMSYDLTFNYLFDVCKTHIENIKPRY